jgi:hypothetical protein
VTKFPAGKRPGPKFDNTPPSGAEVMNEWSSKCTNTSCILGVDRKIFIFVFMTMGEQEVKYAIVSSIGELRVFVSDSHTCPVLPTCQGQPCFSYDVGFHRVVWWQDLNHMQQHTTSLSMFL